MVAFAYEFVAAPLSFFCERELQATFFGQCRRKFGQATPADGGDSIDLFRHEYNTLWRYQRAGDAFSERLDGKGRAGALDFAILDRVFVTQSDRLVVINKHDQRRRDLRRSQGGKEFSSAIAVGIEFKMIHVAARNEPTEAAVRRLRRGLMEDCRKLVPRKRICYPNSAHCDLPGAWPSADAPGSSNWWSPTPSASS